MKYYLRMEGVNLGNFVYDTQDLSTVRGGGLLLLDAVERVESALRVNDTKVNAITTGASSGLFEVETENINLVVKEVESCLKKDVQLRHATFVVDIIEAGADQEFPRKKEELLALNRWRQMQSPSLSVPSPSPGRSIPCFTDLIRPQSAEKNRNRDQNAVSESVYQRWSFGRSQKRGDFYTALPDHVKNFTQAYPGKAALFKDAEIDAAWLLKEGLAFTQDLDQLSKCEELDNLDHKIAVIYADGNSFGKRQQTFDLEALKEFDLLLKAHRSSFLLKLLSVMQNDAEWKNGNAYRLETLLWGGDEFMLIVPAWKGWETLRLFFEQSAAWTFGGEPLTHSAGLVFCHHNAPIHRIKQLAHDLAEICKGVENESFKKDQEKYEERTPAFGKGNYAAFQVLESFDSVPGSLAKFRQSRCPQKTHYGSMMMAGADLQSIGGVVTAIKRDDKVSRGRLHRIVKSLVAGRDDEARQEIEKLEALAIEETKRAFKEAAVLFNGEDARWPQLAELWDYIVSKEVRG